MDLGATDIFTMCLCFKYFIGKLNTHYTFKTLRAAGIGRRPYENKSMK